MSVRVRYRKDRKTWTVDIHWRGERISASLRSKQAAHLVAAEIEKTLALADLLGEASDNVRMALARVTEEERKQYSGRSVPTVREYSETWKRLQEVDPEIRTAC